MSTHQPIAADELQRMIDELKKDNKKLIIERDKAHMAKAEVEAELGRVRCALNRALKGIKE